MSDKCSHEWINALVCTKCGKVARSSHTYDDVVTCTEAKLAEALKRIAELEAENTEQSRALKEMAKVVRYDRGLSKEEYLAALFHAALLGCTAVDMYPDDMAVLAMKHAHALINALNVENGVLEEKQEVEDE